MFFARFIALLVLPALLWSFRPAQGLAACDDFSAASQAYIAKERPAQLGALVRDSQSRSISVATFRPLETPLERFSEPVLVPQLSELRPERISESCSLHRAPSLTGVVELLI